MAPKDTQSKQISSRASSPTSLRDTHRVEQGSKYREGDIFNMSRSHAQPCTFADIAASYRVYILDDLLAEPQEIVHDWYRNVLYISQRHRQGNSFAPIEMSHEISIFDLSVGDVVSSIDTGPYTGPHCLELDSSCEYLHACVNGGSVWIRLESGVMTNFEASDNARAQRSSEDFIAEVDLRTGKMRHRVNVPEQTDGNATDGRHVAFSAPAIRFASRSSSNGLPVVEVSDDPVVDILKAKFSIRTIYVTSRNVMLV